MERQGVQDGMCRMIRLTFPYLAVPPMSYRAPQALKLNYPPPRPFLRTTNLNYTDPTTLLPVIQNALLAQLVWPLTPRPTLL
jgi:hypothetical protein